MLVPLGLASAVAETFGAASVFTLIAVVENATSGDLPRLARPIAARLANADQRTVVLVFTLIVLALYLLRNVLMAVAAAAQERVMAASASALSEGLFRGYLGAPYEFHLRRDSSTSIQRVSDAVDAVLRTVLASTASLASEAFVVVGITLVLAAMAPQATLATVVVVLLLLLVPVALTRRAFRRWGGQRLQLESRVLRRVQEGLGGFKEARIAGREGFFFDAFAADHRALMRLRWQEAVASSVLRLGLETVFVAGLLLVVMVVTVRGAGGASPLAALGLFAYAGFRMIPSANRIMLNVSQLRLGHAYVEALRRDVEDVARQAGAEEHDTASMTFDRSIALEHVSYRYGERGEAILDDVDLVVAKGESVGIVGATGVGKSTLVDVVLGLLQPTSGRVLVDGRDIRPHPRAWQRRLGYVSQTPFLLDDTLTRNIAFGLRDEDIDQSRVEATVRMAGLETFVASLPAGLDTTVGERGTRLSGGERQRVAIARALYPDPDVLVFDEATSALDYHVEREIARALGALKGARTLLVVAHRLTTLRQCDRLALVEGGRIADSGSFEDLLARNAGFRELARLGSILEQADRAATGNRLT